MTSVKIRMGNDEFILYIRKNFKHCLVSNDVLGRKIWEWLRTNANADAHQLENDKPCYWGDQGFFIAENKLPKTATQFEFNSCVLPNLYLFLADLSAGKL